MEDIAVLTHQLEYLFLKNLIHGMRNGTITLEAAKKAAQDFRKIEPFVNENDAFSKIANFFETHSEFPEVKKYMDLYNTERNTQEKIKIMRNLIKENNIDEALNVARV